MFLQIFKKIRAFESKWCRLLERVVTGPSLTRGTRRATATLAF